MLIAPKRLKIRTSNLASVFSGIVPTWPLTNISEKWAWSRSRDPVNFWALNANSSKTAKDTNFKFGRCATSDSSDMTLANVSKKWAWSGSRDPVHFWALSANGRSKMVKAPDTSNLCQCQESTYRKWNVANRVVTWPVTSCNPKGQACNLDIGYLRLNISTTVQTAAMGRMPRSIERILVCL